MLYDVGEKPGRGHYCCNRCGWRAYLNSNDDRLPPCGDCGKGQKIKYRKC